jgi:hypothetical protein
MTTLSRTVAMSESGEIPPLTVCKRERPLSA